MSTGISSSTLRNLIKQMRENGDNQVVLDVDGTPVTVELRPAPAANRATPPHPCRCLLCGALKKIARALDPQTPRLN